MEIELPNGQVAEFPDDMPHSQIESVLQNHFKATSEDKNQAFGMIKQRFPGMPEGLIRMLMPMAVEEAEHPINTNQSSSLGAFARSAIRTPLEASENFASLIGLPTVKNAEYPGLIQERQADKEHPIANLLGNLSGFVAPGAGAVTAMRSLPAWGKLAEKASGSFLRKAPIYATEGAAMGAGFSPDGQRAENALLGAALGTAGAAVPSAISGFKNLGSRVKSLRNLDKLRGELSQNESHASGLMNEEQNLLDIAEQKPLEATENVERYLGKGKAHDVRAAKLLDKTIETSKKEIGSIYDTIGSELEESHIALPNSRDVKQITSELNEAIKSGGFESKEVQKLAEELDKAHSKSVDLIPGNDFLAMFRSTKRLANKAWRKSRKTDIDAVERQRWEDQAKNLTENAEKMDKLLESHMSKNSYAKLKKANDLWRTEITPLYKNNLYYQIKKMGRLPSDIIHELRGSEEGNILLRKMIKDNPEILKNVLGQKYAGKPKELLNYDENAQEYISQEPALQGLKNTYEEALGFEEAAKKFKKNPELLKKQITHEFGELNKYVYELRKLADRKNISLKEKHEIENRISKAEEDKKYLTSKAVTYFGLGALGLTGYNLSKLFR